MCGDQARDRYENDKYLLNKYQEQATHPREAAGHTARATPHTPVSTCLKNCPV